MQRVWGCGSCVLKITYHWYTGGWDWYSKLVHSETSWNNYSERILAHAFQTPFFKMVSDKTGEFSIFEICHRVERLYDTDERTQNSLHLRNLGDFTLRGLREITRNVNNVILDMFLRMVTVPFITEMVKNVCHLPDYFHFASTQISKYHCTQLINFGRLFCFKNRLSCFVSKIDFSLISNYLRIFRCPKSAMKPR